MHCPQGRDAECKDGGQRVKIPDFKCGTPGTRVMYMIRQHSMGIRNFQQTLTILHEIGLGRDIESFWKAKKRSNCVADECSISFPFIPEYIYIYMYSIHIPVFDRNTSAKYKCHYVHLYVFFATLLLWKASHCKAHNIIDCIMETALNLFIYEDARQLTACNKQVQYIGMYNRTM